MAKELSKKYGFIHFNDNWHEDSFKVWRSICDEKYQEKSTKKQETVDWENFFGRSVEEFLVEQEGRTEYDEYLEFAIIELIKLSQNQKVVADLSLPPHLAVELADHSRIACLVASSELVIRDYYGREDHKEFIECIMSLKEPETKLVVQNDLFRIGVEKTFKEIDEHNLFKIIRTDESTVENTLALLEVHFKLKGI